MATSRTPSRNERGVPAIKRFLVESPISKTNQTNHKSKKNKTDKLEKESEKTELDLNDIWTLMNEIKQSLSLKLDQVETKVNNLENIIDGKLEEVKSQMIVIIKKEVKEQGVKIEEEINHSFSFLEDQLKGKMAQMETVNNDLEQYTRKNSIRLFGIKEDVLNIEEAAIEIFNTNLDTAIKQDDIEIIHRVGKKIPDKPRPVIIKFVSHKKKVEIMRSKKALKGSEFFIIEDLTQQNSKLMRELNILRKSGKIKSTWSIDGKIKIKLNNDSIKAIRNLEDIKELSL